MIEMRKRSWRPRRATVEGFPQAQVVGRVYQPPGHNSDGLQAGRWGLTLKWAATREQQPALEASICNPLMANLTAAEAMPFELSTSTARGTAILTRVSDTREEGYDVVAEFEGTGPLRIRRRR